MDIDKFKQINDQYGHDIGDLALKTLAQTCAGRVRTSDIFGRYGGEEFLLILPGAGKLKALDLAERIREAVEGQITHTPTDERLQITVSIGVATYPEDGQNVTPLVKAADQAMYSAKEQGRNRVVAAEHDILYSI
jgi:diguanylate cyclase (GGDEF)-like protein